jgi:hypothetical protein
MLDSEISSAEFMKLVGCLEGLNMTVDQVRDVLKVIDKYEN